MIYKNFIFTIFLSLILFSNALTATAQQAKMDKMWLDKPITSWNNAPKLPKPTAKNIYPEMEKRCAEEIRKPANAAESLVAKMGWKLYGASQRYGTTQLFTALSGFDGMCRPVGYQGFVYLEGKFAGTLSPVLMDSRSDGSMTDLRLTSATTISADYMRYSESDALCCPSRTSYVSFELKRNNSPKLMPTYMNTEKNCSPDELEQKTTVVETNSLGGKHWVLTKIDDKSIDADLPFIEFDLENMRAFGDAGCNRFTGGFTMSGSSLKFSQMAATMRACYHDEDSQLESNFLRNLDKTTRFEIIGETLNLYAGDKLTLVFKAKDATDKETARVTGTVSYLQRIALSPSAVIKVQLLDISKADATAEVIAEQTINANGKQVPFTFELQYDPSVIKDRNRYVIRAEILENGKLQWTSTQAYSVITNGNGDNVKVIVNQIK